MILHVGEFLSDQDEQADSAGWMEDVTAWKAQKSIWWQETKPVGTLGANTPPLSAG